MSGSTHRWRSKTERWRLLVPLFVLSAVLVLLAGCGTVTGPDGTSAVELQRKTIQSGGVTRSYLVHVPPSYQKGKPAPLVFVFHGGGGQGQGMVELTHFNDVSDRNGFIVVYPDGIGRNWNDGRPEINPGVEDIGFIRDLLARLESDYSIDEDMVYSTGISNGGFFSYRLAQDLDGTFAAIAPVAAPMSEQEYAKQAPPRPVSVLLIMGRDDPLCPYSGGAIGGGRRGRCVSAGDTVRYWSVADGCAPTPAVTELPDTRPGDGTRVTEELYTGGRAGTEVGLLTVEGGGHTWSGGKQYLPVRTIGRTSRDIDASEVIWEFFSSHPRR